jgi:hypothetical protein
MTKEHSTSETQTQKPQRGNGSELSGLVVRLFRYLFVRRLAITPYRALNDFEDNGQRWLFEWQKMPGGYRWY